MASQMMAYIDPGSGSLLLQLIVGCGVGASLFFRQQLAKIFRLFRRSSESAQS